MRGGAAEQLRVIVRVAGGKRVAVVWRGVDVGVKWGWKANCVDVA